VGVLLIDESAAGDNIPWNAIAPKLAGGALVVAFAWTAEGYGRHARFTLPAPVAGEVMDDIPAAVDGVTAAFRMAAPWGAPAAGVVNPPDFVAKLAGIATDNTMRERADAIHKAARGQVFTPADGKTVALKEMTQDDFWKALNAGACWMGEKQPLPVSSTRPYQSRDREGAVAEGPLAIVSGESAPPPLLSPLGSKLYRESNLRQATDLIALAPATARAHGVVDGGRAILEAGGMRLPVTVAFDMGLPPGVVRMAGDCPAPRGKVVPV
jgi:hypothetical protein